MSPARPPAAATARTLSSNLALLQRTMLVLGLVGVALLVLGGLADPDQLFRSWLVGYLYWLGPTLGSMAVVMLHNMTGGAWGFAVRRLLEAGMRNLPLMLVAFVPVAMGVPRLYEWADPEIVAGDPVLQHKAAYLNVPFFLGRAAAYFAIWLFLAYGMMRLFARYDRSLSIAALRRTKTFSGVGLVAYVLTMSFAAFDWSMSLEPHWFSTIYGVHYVVGQVLTTLALAIVVASRLVRHEPFSRWIEPGHFHDLGNLLLAFVMLWAYVSFSQFLIVWSGNLPEETPYYLARLGTGWQAMAVVLVAFHFAVPFLVLLSRRRKRRPGSLALIALGLLVLRFVDYYWLVAPAFAHGGQPHFHWMDLAAPIAIGALWIWLFVRNLRGRPLVSLQDAKLLKRLEEAPAP